LAIINTAFYQPKKVGPNEVWVSGLFSTIALDLQKSLFVITTTKNVNALDLQKSLFVITMTKNVNALDLQKSLFVITTTKNVKLAMHNPFDVNPITKSWKTFISSQILEDKISKHVKQVVL